MSKKETQKKGEKKEKVNSFSIQNIKLKPLYVWLSIPQHSERAIARNRVVALIKEKMQEFENDRLQLIEEHVKLDDKNERMTTEDGSEFLMKDDAAFDAAWEVLKKQHVTFDILPSNREHWRIAREIVKGTNDEMDIATTDFYEEILTALENI